MPATVSLETVRDDLIAALKAEGFEARESVAGEVGTAAFFQEFVLKVTIDPHTRYVSICGGLRYADEGKFVKTVCLAQRRHPNLIVCTPIRNADRIVVVSGL